MKPIAWPQLIRLGLVRLGLPPAVFWDLTPAELFLMAGAGESREALSKAGLEALAARYPDASQDRR